MEEQQLMGSFLARLKPESLCSEPQGPEGKPAYLEVAQAGNGR